MNIESGKPDVLIFQKTGWPINVCTFLAAVLGLRQANANHASRRELGIGALDQWANARASATLHRVAIAVLARECFADAIPDCGSTFIEDRRLPARKTIGLYRAW